MSAQSGRQRQHLRQRRLVIETFYLVPELAEFIGKGRLQACLNTDEMDAGLDIARFEVGGESVQVGQNEGGVGVGWIG